MSELVILSEKLREDIELWHELLVDAEKNNDLALVVRLEDELAEMKEMLNHIEKPEFSRHLRLVQNEAWREFHNM
jgi:hypothetical protein